MIPLYETKWVWLQELNTIRPRLKSADIIGGLLGDCDMPTVKDEPILETDRILGKNTGSLRALLVKVHHKKEKLTTQELRLALYKIDAWIGSSSYVEAARACHMLGLGKFIDRVPVLQDIATNLNRYPIVRRDACKGLRCMGVLNQQICETLLKATTDKYFETRVEALHALYVLFANNSHKTLDVKKVLSVAIARLDQKISMFECMLWLCLHYCARTIQKLKKHRQLLPSNR